LRSTAGHRQLSPSSARPSITARRSTLARIDRRPSHLTARRRLLSPWQRARPQTWVLPLRDAFLVQMDDFEKLLEHHLRRKLDPVVAAPVPPRRGRVIDLRRGGRVEPAPRRLGAFPIDLRPDALVFVEHS
jgi:hypothetical protein